MDEVLKTKKGSKDTIIIAESEDDLQKIGLQIQDNSKEGKHGLFSLE